MGWGNNSNNGRKPTRKRGPVTWSDRSGGKPAPFAQVIPPYEKHPGPPLETIDHLVIGAMFSANLPLNPDPKSPGQFPHLVPHFWPAADALVTQKSLLIYTGVERVEERERNGRIVSVPRHTFFAGDGRYIVLDFTYITPVTPG